MNAEKPMLDDATPSLQRTGCQQTLAGRLLQLADDSDRVGLHREASVLASFATSVLQGRGLGREQLEIVASVV